MSNHFHLVLRSRPDVVAEWDDTEVARRWLMLCPLRKDSQGQAEEPNEVELNTIRKDPEKLEQIRSRLSDIAWWMRLLSQNIGQRANREDEEVGKFWQARYRAVRLLDETSLLACAAYVDLNPIRAAMAQTLETSDYTSVQKRIQSLKSSASRRSKGRGKRRRTECPMAILPRWRSTSVRTARGPAATAEAFVAATRAFCRCRRRLMWRYWTGLRVKYGARSEGGRRRG